MKNIHLQIDTLVDPQKIISEFDDKLSNSEFCDLIFNQIKFDPNQSKMLFKMLINQDKTLFKEGIQVDDLLSALSDSIDKEATIDEIKRLVGIIEANYSDYIPKEMATWQEAIRHYRSEAVEFLCREYREEILDCIESTEPIPK